MTQIQVPDDFDNGIVSKTTFIGIEFEFDRKFWAIYPSISINLHGNKVTFEFIFLCFGLYIDFNKKKRSNDRKKDENAGGTAAAEK